MTTDDKQLVLAIQLEEYRAWSYAALVAELERTRRERDCLAHLEETFADGAEYQMEFNIFWDDKPGGDVRVCGDLNMMPHIPPYTSDVTDSFIMRCDGSFVGE